MKSELIFSKRTLNIFTFGILYKTKDIAAFKYNIICTEK